MFKAAKGLGKDTNILSIFDEENYDKIVELNEQGALTDDALKKIAKDSEILQAYFNTLEFARKSNFIVVNGINITINAGNAIQLYNL